MHAPVDGVAKSPYGFSSCAGSSAVEQLVYTQLVGGSIPSPRTIPALSLPPTYMLSTRHRGKTGRKPLFREVAGDPLGYPCFLSVSMAKVSAGQRAGGSPVPRPPLASKEGATCRKDQCPNPETIAGKTGQEGNL